MQFCWLNTKTRVRNLIRLNITYLMIKNNIFQNYSDKKAME